MANVRATIKTAALQKTVVLTVYRSPVGSFAAAKVSGAAGNIITQHPDGLYATIDKPNDILDFITAIDNALLQG